MNSATYMFLIGVNTTFLGVGIAANDPVAFVSLLGLACAIFAYACARKREEGC
jgi:hypothetical protein